MSADQFAERIAQIRVRFASRLVAKIGETDAALPNLAGDGQSAVDLFGGLGVERDGAHAFYLGVELARAEIAWQLGKRYAQDEPLAWGTAVDAASPQPHRAPGPTLTARTKRPRDAS